MINDTILHYLVCLAFFLWGVRLHMNMKMLLHVLYGTLGVGVIDSERACYNMITSVHHMKCCRHLSSWRNDVRPQTEGVSFLVPFYLQAGL